MDPNYAQIPSFFFLHKLKYPYRSSEFDGLLAQTNSITNVAEAN